MSRVDRPLFIDVLEGLGCGLPHRVPPALQKVRERVPGLSRFAFNITRFYNELTEIVCRHTRNHFIHRHHLVWAFGFRQLGMGEQREVQPAEFGSLCGK